MGGLWTPLADILGASWSTSHYITAVNIIEFVEGLVLLSRYFEIPESCSTVVAVYWKLLLIRVDDKYLLVGSGQVPMRSACPDGLTHRPVCAVHGS